jgi:D-alanine-D-alanine ligase
MTSLLKRLRVAVLYGGRSGEHEVSLASAAAVWANLNRAKYEPIAVRIERDGRWLLADRLPASSSAAEVIQQARGEGRARGAAKSAGRPATRRWSCSTRGLLGRRQHQGASALARARRDIVFRCSMARWARTASPGPLELANLPYVRGARVGGRHGQAGHEDVFRPWPAGPGLMPDAA